MEWREVSGAARMALLRFQSRGLFTKIPTSLKLAAGCKNTPERKIV
jgi:hypothetical protein